MPKKNYISRAEYELWSYIKDNEIVDTELVEMVFPEMPKAKKNKLLHNLYVKGYLARVRNGLYYNPARLTDFYKLALRIKEGYIGLSSALRHYNLIDYEDFTVFIMTRNFQKKIPLKGTKYEAWFVPLGKYFAGFEKVDNSYISSLEKTFFDCFLKPSLVGFSNITKALYDSKPDWNKFIGYFKLTDNHSVCQRTGYILELLTKTTRFRVPSFVLEFLLKKVKNPVKLLSIGGKSTFNRKWKVQDNVGKVELLSWWN